MKNEFTFWAETFWAMCQLWKLYGWKLFFGGNCLDGSFLSHVVIFGNLMAGNFLGRIRHTPYCILMVVICLF